MDAAAAILLERLASVRPSPAGSVGVLLTGPVGPDGDSIGACLALQRILRARGVAADVAGRIPGRYRWMPGADGVVPDDRVEPAYRAVVVLDGDRDRLTPEVDRAFRAAELKAIVDHHATTTPEGYDLAWIERGADSTCGMLQRQLARWRVPVDRDLAALLYTGILFDTGGFRHSNTTPEVLRAAANLLAHGLDHSGTVIRLLHERTRAGLAAAGHIYADATLACGGRLAIGLAPLALTGGLPDGDLEGVVDTLLMIEGVEVADLILERADGTVKHSLRSRGRIDVAQVARALAPTGGGHPKASGAVHRASLAEASHSATAAVASRLTAPLS